MVRDPGACPEKALRLLSALSARGLWGLGQGVTTIRFPRLRHWQETLQGKVVGECHARHRHQEFLRFLRLLDIEFPGDVPLHLIMANYGTHKHAKVKAWLKRHPRFVSPFVPTSSSWMNLVERWFGHLDNKALRRVADLQGSIQTFLNAWNQAPQPFVWTATVASIQEKLTRCRRTLEQIRPGCTSPKSRKRKQ